MFIEGLHEKDLFSESFPFRLAMNSVDNFEYPCHWHNAVEIVYALEGAYEVDVNGHNLNMGQYDILIIAGGDLHSLSTYGKQGKRAFFQFDLSRVEGFGNANLVKSFLNRTRLITGMEDRELHESLELQLKLILDAFDKKEFAYELYINGRLLDILVLLSRSLIIRPDSKGTCSKSKVYGLEKINRALQYIEENYCNDITLKDVSNAAGFSEFHFSRLFKEITEKNFNKYLNEFRIKKAEKLISEHNMTITEAAHISGFNSLVTFNRLFRELKGCSPSQYKKLYI